MKALRFVSAILAAFSLLVSPIAADARARNYRPGLSLIPIYVPPAPTNPVEPAQSDAVATWDSDTLPVIADGAAVGTWTDSTNGAIATPVAGPTYKTNVQGTHPSIRFPGGGVQRMEVSNATALRTAIDSRVYTVLITMKNIGTNGYGTAFAASAAGYSFLYLADTAAGGVGSLNGSGPTLAPVVPNSMMTFGSSSSLTPIGAASQGIERIFVQGGIVSSLLSPGSGTGGHTITIGNIEGGNSFFGLKGDVLRIKVYKRVLTPSELISYQKFVDWKYGQVDPWTTAGKMTLFDGDSITAGVGTSAASQNYPYKAAQSLGLPYGAWSNLAIGGIKYSDMVAKAPTEIDNVAAITGVPTHLAAFEWANEQGAANPVPTSNAIAYLQGRAAAGVAKITFGTSTSTASDPTNRAVYNSFWDANPTTYNQRYVPIHNDANIGVNGAYSNTTYFGDGVHPTAAGYTILAGLMSAQMATLPN